MPTRSVSQELEKNKQKKNTTKHKAHEKKKKKKQTKKKKRDDGRKRSYRGHEEATDETAHRGPDHANTVGEPVVGAPEGVVGAVELVGEAFVSGYEPPLRLTKKDERGDDVNGVRYTMTTITTTTTIAPKVMTMKTAKTTLTTTMAMMI